MELSIPTITKYKEKKASPINFSCAIYLTAKLVKIYVFSN